MVLKDGAKMSKSLGNTVDPKMLIDQYGADTLRLFIMFASPPEVSLEWSDSGVEGSFRFLKRLWRFIVQHVNEQGLTQLDFSSSSLNEKQKKLRRQTQATIQKVTDDFKRRFTFNTAIAAMMELLNALSTYSVENEMDKMVKQEAFEAIVLMLSPIVPHITHVLWQKLGHQAPILDATWPTVDESALKQETIQVVVQINGKVRTNIILAVDASKEMLEKAALDHETIQRHLDGKVVKKVIVVGQKLVNIVAV
jgi:leucyl-tRNA synthetase